MEHGQHAKVPITHTLVRRRRLLLPLLRRHGQFIGQVRKDTALFRDPPPRTSQRGRPRKYGTKFTPEDIAALTTEIVSLHIYGKWQKVRLQSMVAKARSGVSI